MVAWKQLHCHVLYLHAWRSDSVSKGCFSPALWSLSGGDPGDDIVQKRADLICLSVCEWPEAHTVSKCGRAAHPTRCANHNLPPTVCFLRRWKRKGICKAKNNFPASSGAEGEIRSKLLGHQGSNSSNMRGCSEILLYSIHQQESHFVMFFTKLCIFKRTY